MKLKKEIEKILEDNGVSYKIYKETKADSAFRFYAECEYTDAPHGMDFVFIVECGSSKNFISECFVRNFIAYANDYDADEEASPYLEMWCSNHDDIRTRPPRPVLEDCDDCGEMLEKVAEELSKPAKKKYIVHVERIERFEKDYEIEAESEEQAEEIAQETAVYDFDKECDITNNAMAKEVK